MLHPEMQKILDERERRLAAVQVPWSVYAQDALCCGVITAIVCLSFVTCGDQAPLPVGCFLAFVSEVSERERCPSARYRAEHAPLYPEYSIAPNPQDDMSRV